MNKTCANPDCPNVNPQPYENFSADKSTRTGLTYYCKQCLLIKAKQWREKNPDKVKANNRTDRLRYARGIVAAKKREHVCTLTFDQWQSLVIGQVCHYDGQPLGDTGWCLDRKDSNLGYTIDNVVPCCTVCNRTKGHYISYDEMLLLQAYRKIKCL